MPLDRRNYPSADRRPQKRPNNLISYGIAVFAALMLLVPISLGALIDIVKYLRAS